MLGDDVAGGEERHQAEGEHAGRMGEGDGEAQENGLAGGAPRADQIGADDGLAVARREGVEGPESEGH